MVYNYCILFLLFFLYSVIGYIIEIICVSLIEKKLVLSRGFLIGPYLPIYGVGAIIMTCFLAKYQNDVLALFIMSTVWCSILEYVTSFIMEKLFKLRWWDYSEKKFNINGRICLENGILFGLGGVLIVEFINPILKNILFHVPSVITMTIGIVLSVIFIIDLIISTYIMFRLKINVTKYTNKDATTDIRKEVKKALTKHTFLTTRLLNSFPHISNNKNSESLKELLSKTKKEIEKYKQKNHRK